MIIQSTAIFATHDALRETKITHFFIPSQTFCVKYTECDEHLRVTKVFITFAQNKSRAWLSETSFGSQLGFEALVMHLSISTQRNEAQ